jgi:glycine cleavage system aminomethyltransferase T
MGEFLLTGPNALALIQKVTSNDASTLMEEQYFAQIAMVEL